MYSLQALLLWPFLLHHFTEIEFLQNNSVIQSRPDPSFPCEGAGSARIIYGRFLAPKDWNFSTHTNLQLSVDALYTTHDLACGLHIKSFCFMFVLFETLSIVMILGVSSTENAIFDKCKKKFKIFSNSRDCNKKHWNKHLRWNTNWVHAF